MNKYVIVLIVIITAAVLFLIYRNTSLFGDMCQRDNRQYPEGQVPGSALFNKSDLLKNFIRNNPNLT